MAYVQHLCNELRVILLLAAAMVKELGLYQFLVLQLQQLVVVILVLFCYVIVPDAQREVLMQGVVEGVYLLGV